MGLIELKGMEFHAFIGHYDEEKQIGNNFKVDIKLWYDHTKAAETDRLFDALDYQHVYNIVRHEMSEKCNLLENVANRIIKKLIRDFPQLDRVSVKIRKLYPKLGGMVEEVSFEIDSQEIRTTV